MIKNQIPIVISFMGVDGSGKTTLSKKIKNIFQNSKYLHLKPYILFQDRRRVIKNPHNQKKSTIVVSLIRLLSWLISYKIFFYTNKKERLFIFDRYAHDIIIDPLRYKHNLPKFLTDFLLSLFPRPDLWIFLNPSLKIIKLRKFELSESELSRQIKKYYIFFKNKKNVLILNNHGKKKTLIKIIKNKINLIIK